MEDNTFECPNCGAKVYPEMTRCPQCGHNMYPEDEIRATPEEGTGATNWTSQVGGVLLGWIVACGINLILHLVVASFISPSNLGGFSKTVLFAAAPVGTFIGALVCAIIARQRRKLLGALVALLSLPVLALLTTHWYEVTWNLVLSPLMLMVSAITILAGVGGGWLNEILSDRSAWQEKWRVRGWENMLYQDLLRKVRFNGSIAERLIEYERDQNPDASRLKLIQNAIERWERDNR
jgi:zinc-ribbon domain